MKNSNRFDLSDWLIHFFRRIDLSSRNAPHVPETFGFGNVNEDDEWSALFMLRCAVRAGRLWATWSYRNDIRTIYGPHPAVCFTEMPLAALLEAGPARAARGEAMSQFALVFPKKAMFSIGANPVIYGLDSRAATLPPATDSGPRIIDTKLLPSREQYRYVTYNPIATRPIDWTHEREWRWPFRGDRSAFERELEDCGQVSNSDEIPGLYFHTPALRGMGVVVATAEQGMWITHDILSLVDRELLAHDHYSFVLSAEKLPTDGRLRDPGEIAAALRAASVDLSPYFKKRVAATDRAEASLSLLIQKVVAKHSKIEHGESGSAWLWLLDNTHPFVRSLLPNSRAIVSNEGRYLFKIPEFDEVRGLAQREEMLRDLAGLVTKKFGTEAGYFSVLGSSDPNGVPFYCDDHLDNNMFYNKSWI